MKLNYKRTFFVGLAFMSICTFWAVYDQVIPVILKNSYGIGDTAAGFIMALDNILALFMLPLFGTLSDKTKTPIGKRMPYVIGGTIIASLTMIFIPIIINYTSNQSYSIVLFMIALAILLLAMSTYRSPAVALMPDITPKPLRSKANAVINLMGTVGGIVALGLIAFLVPKKVDLPNYFPLFASIAGVMIACVVVLFITIKENKYSKEVSEIPQNETIKQAHEHDKLDRAHFKSLVFILLSVAFWFIGYNAVTTAFSKYAEQVWGMTVGESSPVMIFAQASALLAFIPIGYIASKVGRKRTICAGIILLTAAFLGGVFVKDFRIIIVLFVLAGIGWASINVNSYPMVVEMSKGSNVGKYTGYYYTFSMSAQIVTPILSGFLLEHVGYWTLFPYAAFFVALSFVTMLFVKHGDSISEPKKSKLEMLDVGD